MTMTSNIVFYLIISFFCSTLQVSARLKNSVEKMQQRQQAPSSNRIPELGGRQKSADHHNYYDLPMQTTFGSPYKPSAIEGAITSPPHLSIEPSVVDHGQKSTVIAEKGVNFPSDRTTPYLSQCITEAPSRYEQPKSDILLPSEDVIPKSVVLSGHIEIASKTSSELYAPEIANTAAGSLLQGTQIHLSSITDVYVS